MGRLILMVICFVISFFAFSQHLTGYYESEPQLEDYDHFKIHHYHKSLEVKAYLDGGEVWRSIADEVEGEKAQYFIRNYSEGEDIKSVHFVNVLLDGLQWEFFLLSFEDEQGKNAFIVVEEIFTDESETELLEINTFRWFHKHHQG